MAWLEATESTRGPPNPVNLRPSTIMAMAIPVTPKDNGHPVREAATVVSFPAGWPADQSASSDAATPLLLNPAYSRTKSLVSDELRNFRICLKWCALDHSSCAGKVVSYVTFAVLTVAVPALTSLAIHPPPKSALPVSSVNKLVQLPESALAAISFFTLCSFFQRYGLRQLLFLDGLRDDSVYVRRGYAHELDRAFKYLTYILLPSFSIELVHKLIFFSRVYVSVPIGSYPPTQKFPCNYIAFLASVASWVYRTGLFLLVCVLFRLTCALQILRLDGFRKLMEGCGSDAGAILKEHTRIRKQLLVTSHRYRIFIIGCLVTVTISQLGALLLILSSKFERNFCNSGDLLVCSVVQLSGFFMCLLGAARITHRAQGVVAIASRWHLITMTCPLSSASEPTAAPAKDQVAPSPPGDPCKSPESPAALLAAREYAAVETRKALVKYLQHNNGGITLFGFALDRGLLHTLFAFEMSLVLWILSKVVVVS